MPRPPRATPCTIYETSPDSKCIAQNFCFWFSFLPAQAVRGVNSSNPTSFFSSTYAYTHINLEHKPVRSNPSCYVHGSLHVIGLERGVLHVLSHKGRAPRKCVAPCVWVYVSSLWLFIEGVETRRERCPPQGCPPANMPIAKPLYRVIFSEISLWHYFISR